ncbi:PREDICTED: phosphatidylinositol-glycan-specific phospholipase D [Myotis davidii]|uniref:phosphatidylinositol-glycan-specific phospholipase D n=1 Tax=Myotis davidii TaxID=225400 RepID=UPI000767D8D7|nr:PREDICTED: phosphatidylinositol-glycan-specific phospholipase D [Myotis davidii]
MWLNLIDVCVSFSGHRALEFLHLQEGSVNYRQLLLEHQDAYQAGAVFPDAFYPGICQRGRFHEVSESTHWTPFLNASVHYIREHYPPPWEKDAEKLVAFLLGVTSHMVADVSWHSLGIEQGFLRTMAAMDFHGSYSEAHPAGDFGGDVLSQFEFNFNYLARHWYVPVEDLLGIYRELYGKDVITKHVIVECTYLQFLEMYGEVLAVSKVQPPSLEPPRERLCGPGQRAACPPPCPPLRPTGLAGSCEHTCAGDCSLPENPLFIACGGQRPSPQGSQVQKSDAHRNLTASLPKDAGKNINYTARGAVFSVDSWTSDSMNRWASHTGRGHPIPGGTLGGRATATPALGLQQPRGRETQAVIASYPPRDRSPGPCPSREPARGTDGDCLVLLLSRPHSRLAYPRQGAVYVYFGSKKGKLSQAPDVSISCQDTYCNLGWRLLAADVDGDGMAFLTMTLHQGGATRMYRLSPAARPALLSTFSGDRRFSRFGGVLHLSDLDGDGLDEVFMAAPLRIADMTSGLIGGEDGRVYIYNGRRTFFGDMTGKCKSWTSPCPEEKAQHVLISPEASSRFGSGLVTVRSQDKNQVVVAAERSSLGARLAGALHVYSLDSDWSPARVPAAPADAGRT